MEEILRKLDGLGNIIRLMVLDSVCDVLSASDTLSNKPPAARLEKNVV
jgi:hypothetical protein